MDFVVFFGQGVEVFFEQNILGSDVCKDEVDFSFVISSVVMDNGMDNLEYGCDISIISDYVKVMYYVGFVDEGIFGVFDVDSLINDEGSYEFGDVVLRVVFDQEIEVVGLVVVGDGSVGMYNFLKFVIFLGEDSVDGDMLIDGEVED